MMAVVGLWPGEDVHFDRLLAAVGLGHRAAADVGARLDIGDRRLQHGGDRRVIGELERDRAAVAPFRVNSITVDPLDRAVQALGLLALLLGRSGGNSQCGGKGSGGQNACLTHVATSVRGSSAYKVRGPRRKVSGECTHAPASASIAAECPLPSAWELTRA
jgi:hypothetical protein